MANLRKGVLNKVEHFLAKQKYPYEVIIVDDGSTDGSVDFIQEFNDEYPEFKLIRSEHLGKAGAVTKGMLRANGKYVLFTDMDQATPIEEVKNLLVFLEQDFSVVIGSRSTKRKGSPLSRVIMSKSVILLRKIIVGLPEVNDTQCGFKAFRGEIVKPLFNKVSEIHRGYKKISGSAVTAGFDMELLLIAKNMQLSIKEVPVSWLYVESRRVNPVRDSVEGVLELLKIRQNKLKGKYE